MKQKLNAKDFILIGILTALMWIICMIISTIMSVAGPVTNVFYPSVVAIPNGIVMMLLLAKVPKKGVFTICAAIQAILFLLVGAFWFIPIGLVIGGVICDFLVMGRKEITMKSMTVAYALFSAYCSLVYVTPILGGYLADKLLGNRMAVMLGALLMAIGHLVLGASETAPLFLYLSLAIIVCGYGLFKSNVSCLLGELYEPADPRRDGGFSLMYAAGNIGSIIAPIACGYVQEEYSWAMGFALAAIGMVAGLVIFLCGNRHFQHTAGVNRQALCARRFLLPNWGWLLVLLVTAPLLIAVLFWQEWSVYALIVATAIGLAVLARIYLRAETDKQRKDLRLIVVLTAFSLLFWAFAQQGGSSISLYIDRFVNRHIMSYEVPTAMFQSINAFAVMLCGMVLAWLVKESVNGNRTVRIWGKFALGLGLMSAGFCILTLSARWSAAYGQSSIPLMVLGLAVMGFAELFIDTIAMSQITRIEIPGVTGVLTGIYMLLSGAIANYLAGVIADQTSQASFDAAGAVNYSIDAYITVFSQITWGALACVGVVLVIWLYHSLKVRTRRLAVE